MFAHYYKQNHGIYISEHRSKTYHEEINQGILFLDRDGVIIEEKHYLSDPKQVEIISGARDVIDSAAENGMKVVIVTNQSGIGRGLFNWDSYVNVTNSMLDLLGEQAYNIDLILACPMHPDAKVEDYRYKDHIMRKPNPGMINFACERFDITSSDCIMVGDKLCDINAGKRAGINHLFHVKTGHGSNHRDDIIELNRADRGLNINCISSIKQLKQYLHSRPLLSKS